MKCFHIIEQTNDQQVVEVYTGNANTAISTYLQYSTHETVESIERNGNKIIWNYPTEYCVMTIQTEQLIFAKWISKLGLY